MHSNPNNPAFDCIFNPCYRQTFARKETDIPTVGIRVDHLVLDSDIDTDVIAPYAIPIIAPWTIQPPATTSSYILWKTNSLLTPTYSKFNSMKCWKYTLTTLAYTQTAQKMKIVPSAAVTGQTVMQCRLPGCSSVFTAELQAIHLALDFIDTSQDTKFVIFSDSLSSLQKQSTADLMCQ